MWTLGGMRQAKACKAWARPISPPSAVTAALIDDTHDAPTIWQQRIARVPLGRSGAVNEVAAVVQFLLSEQASFVHGQAINVCGGMVMQ